MHGGHVFGVPIWQHTEEQQRIPLQHTAAAVGVTTARAAGSLSSIEA